jgi:hypothetical protein
MEELSAYEYGNQFAVLSVLKWTELARVVGLRLKHFFAECMEKDVNTRTLRDTADIVS